VRRTLANLLEQAINCNDADSAAKIIQQALGIESDDVANYVFPKTWLADREQRAAASIRYPVITSSVEGGW